MRLTILTNLDVAASLALHYLLPVLNHHNVTIFYTAKRRSNSNAPQALLELADYEASLPYTKSAFEQTNAIKLNSVNRGIDFEQFVNSAPDLVVSIRHMSILTQRTIDIAPQGVINLHSGILPDYRGVMATFWAMLNNEHKIGSTLHYIDSPAIDTGTRIHCSMIEVDYQQSYFWNTLNLYKNGCDDIARVVNQIQNKQTLALHEQAKNGNYYSFPSSSDLLDATFSLFNRSEDISGFFV